MYFLQSQVKARVIRNVTAQYYFATIYKCSLTRNIDFLGGGGEE